MNTNYGYIIADHIRSAAFMIADGVLPSPKQRGYVLRRLIRRALLASMKINVDISNKQYFEDLVNSITTIYDGVYESLKLNEQLIVDTLVQESNKFLKARATGEKEWAKYLKSGKSKEISDLTTFAWDMYQSHGVPFEVSLEQAENAGLVVNEQQLHQLVEEHQQKSATLSAGQFKSGLGEDTQKTRKLHTATHLLHAVLRTTFGTEVRQIGSAITDTKARFDVTLVHEISATEEKLLAQKVQELIDTASQVTRLEMPEKEARQIGAIGLFGEKYPEIVIVYSIEDARGNVLSREFCGGPHVENTKEIGKFTLLKIKSIGQGRKRFEFTVE